MPAEHIDEDDERELAMQKTGDAEVIASKRRMERGWTVQHRCSPSWSRSGDTQRNCKMMTRLLVLMSEVVVEGLVMGWVLVAVIADTD